MNSQQIIKKHENNQIKISGQFSGNFVFDHEVFGEAFYRTEITVERKSSTLDTIPVVISERLLDVNQNHIGEFVRITGQFRSYNKQFDSKARLILFVFAREIEFSKTDDGMPNENYVYLDGYVCKNPEYRKTPLGREITDILLAVNRPYGKSDYIPCICWGRNALYTAGFQIGTHIQVTGRIQSRVYQKNCGNEITEERTAYEVSVCKVMEVAG